MAWKEVGPKSPLGANPSAVAGIADSNGLRGQDTALHQRDGRLVIHTQGFLAALLEAGWLAGLPLTPGTVTLTGRVHLWLTKLSSGLGDSVPSPNLLLCFYKMERHSPG
jgi:hypothetical protein